MRARGAAALPDEVGLHAHDRVAPAHLAAGDAFEEEAVLARLGQLQHQRDRRVEVGDEAGPDHLVPARGEAGGEVLDRREELHRGSGEAGQGGLEQRLVHRHPGLVAERRGVEREEVAARLLAELAAQVSRICLLASAAGSKASTAVTSARITPSRSRWVTGVPSAAAKTSATSSGGAPSAVSPRVSGPALRIGRSRRWASVGEGEAALELGQRSRRRASAARRRCAPRASRRRRGRGSRRAGSPRAGRSSRRAGWRGRRRRARQVGLLAGLGRERGLAEGGVVGDAARWSRS